MTDQQTNPLVGETLVTLADAAQDFGGLPIPIAMSTTHNSLSPQAIKRLQGGEMILNGWDNEDIADALQIPPPPFKNGDENCTITTTISTPSSEKKAPDACPL